MLYQCRRENLSRQNVYNTVWSEMCQLAKSLAVKVKMDVCWIGPSTENQQCLSLTHDQSLLVGNSVDS